MSKVWLSSVPCLSNTKENATLTDDNDTYDGHDEPTLEEDATRLHDLLVDQGLQIDPYSIAVTSIAQILQWSRYEYSTNANEREFMILDAVATVLHTLDPDLTVVHLPQLIDK